MKIVIVGGLPEEQPLLQESDVLTKRRKSSFLSAQALFHTQTAACRISSET